jgi:hypothetical protein
MIHIAHCSVIRQFLGFQFGNTFEANGVATVGGRFCHRKTYTAFFDHQF